MQLVSLTHDDFYSLRLKDLNLQPLNLIVGKNANGKSRTMATIDHFTGLLSEKRRHFWTGKWETFFLLDSGESLHYIIVRPKSGSSDQSIIYESLTVNNKLLIDRKNKDGEIFCRVFSETTNQFEDFSPPSDQLVLHTRRDTRAYPIFEKLIGWGDNAYSFKFGQVLPKDYFDTGPAMSSHRYWGSPHSRSPEESQRLVDVYAVLPPDRQNEVIKLMNEMGYQLTSIKVVGVVTTSNENNQEILSRDLLFYESDVERFIPAFNLSQGMIRTISLLIYLFYLIYIKKPQFIIIDDLGEGLDYSRVVRLGKFIFDTCKQAGVQLIATSNDGFLMDAIPIRYWNVLQRNGSEITALNEKNHPDLFNDFAFTGLSNFDFFSSDYIDSKLR